MSERTRDPLALFAVLCCWASWAASALFVVRGVAPAYRFWADRGDTEMVLSNLSFILLVLFLPTLVALCATGMLGGSVVWAGVTSFLLIIQLLLTLGLSILVSSPEEPARYGFAAALATLLLLVVVGSALSRLSRAR